MVGDDGTEETEAGAGRGRRCELIVGEIGIRSSTLNLRTDVHTLRDKSGSVVGEHDKGIHVQLELLPQPDHRRKRELAHFDLVLATAEPADERRPTRRDREIRKPNADDCENGERQSKPLNTNS